MSHLFWYDVETTGPDDTKDELLEIAGVITDLELRPQCGWFHAVLALPFPVEGMSDWIRRTHGANGLLDACGQSNLRPAELDRALDMYLAPWAQGGEDPDHLRSAGSGVHFDLRVLRRACPHAAGRLSYRCFDTSAMKQGFRAWGEVGEDGFVSRKAHRARPDVEEELENAALLRAMFMQGARDP